MDLTQLDSELHGPMVVRVAGKSYELKSATELSWKAVHACVANANYFMALVWPREARIPAWKIDAAQQRWIVHNGLPFVAQLDRLIYMVEKYGEGVEYDLRTKCGVSLGDWWRDRRWRELLTLIDHLPSDTHMNKLLSQDEEYMRRVLKAQNGSSNRPSMADWSQTNALLANLIDAVNRNTVVTQTVAGTTKGPKPSYDPYPRPATAADGLEDRMRREAHEEMNAILLRDRNR